MKKQVKKITVNFSYGCYKFSENVSCDYISFSIDKIRFVRKPLYETSISNPIIEISYKPQGLINFTNNKPSNSYSDDFEQLCLYSESMKDGHYKICDIVPPSLDVQYIDGSIITYRNLMYNDDSPFKEIMKIVEKYIPNVVKRLNDKENNEK